MREASPCLIDTTSVWAKLILWSNLGYEWATLQETVAGILGLRSTYTAVWLVTNMPDISCHQVIFRWHELREIEGTASELFETTDRLVVYWRLGVRKRSHLYLLGIVEIDRHLGSHHLLIHLERLVQILISLISSRKGHCCILLVDLLEGSCMLVYTRSLAALDHAEVLGMLASTMSCGLGLRLSCFSMDLSLFLFLNTGTVDDLVVCHQGVILLLDDCWVVHIRLRSRHGTTKLILRVHASNVYSRICYLDVVRHS